MNRRWLPALRLGFALLACIAIGWQLKIHVQLGFSVVNFFSYFTNLSNLLAAGVLFMAAAFDAGNWRASRERIDQLRALSVVNMTLVGIVYVVLLRDVDLGALLPWINFVLHYVMPCVVLLDWFIDPPAKKLGAKQLLLMQIFAAAYLIYVLVRGKSIGWYPYPFLDPDNVGGYGGVAAYAIGIALTFLMVGWLLLTLAHKFKSTEAA